jgi:hypothetical protein
MAHDPDKLKSMRTAGMYAMIPAILLAAPVVGFFIGDFLTRWLHAGEWLRALMATFGLAAGGRQVYLIIKKASKE